MNLKCNLCIFTEGYGILKRKQFWTKKFWRENKEVDLLANSKLCDLRPGQCLVRLQAGVLNLFPVSVQHSLQGRERK